MSCDEAIKGEDWDHGASEIVVGVGAAQMQEAHWPEKLMPAHPVRGCFNASQNANFILNRR